MREHGNVSDRRPVSASNGRCALSCASAELLMSGSNAIIPCCRAPALLTLLLVRQALQRFKAIPWVFKEGYAVCYGVCQPRKAMQSAMGYVNSAP